MVDTHQIDSQSPRRVIQERKPMMGNGVPCTIFSTHVIGLFSGNMWDPLRGGDAVFRPHQGQAEQLPSNSNKCPLCLAGLLFVSQRLVGTGMQSSKRIISQK
eukprot:6087412-Amphidinium_carterae.1